MHVTIKNDRASAIIDTFGGELISCRDHNGIEYLWSGDEKFWSGRSPHLFPIIGTLKDDQTLIEGNYYSMKKHGFVRNSEFQIHKINEQSVTLVLKDSILTHEVYPFSFSLYVEHSLLENGFTTSYRIVNQDDKVMYFNIGGHVGVRCPIMPNEKFEDYEVIFDRLLTTSAYFPPNDDPLVENQQTPLLRQKDTISLSYDLFTNGALIIDHIPSHSLQLRHKLYNRGVSFDYEGFPVLALWTFGMKKAPYLCLEPWHGLPAMADDTIHFEEKPYMIALNPNQEKQLQYTMKIID
jgi:galactose mutarotase-like enzyme